MMILRNLISCLLLTLSITCFGQAEINADTTVSIDPNAHIDLELGAKLYQTNCQACHGPQGEAPVATFPKLAGQSDNYIRKQLADYQKEAQGGRNNPIMVPIAKKLTSNDIDNLLAYVDGFKPTNGAADPQLLAAGQKLYQTGDTKRQIPACSACHSPTGSGNYEARFPMLAGQNQSYIIAQLQAFSSGQRSNDPNQMMRMIASKLTPQDMNAVASYINGLKPLS